jgi:hypothetical protein
MERQAVTVRHTSPDRISRAEALRAEAIRDEIGMRGPQAVPTTSQPFDSLSPSGERGQGEGAASASSRWKGDGALSMTASTYGLTS